MEGHYFSILSNIYFMHFFLGAIKIQKTKTHLDFSKIFPGIGSALSYFIFFIIQKGGQGHELAT